VYSDFASLEADFVSGKIHPGDLKPAVTDAINAIIEPVRQHIASGEPKKLLEKIKKFKVTR
jgi:tyrosyl-tRNA synthetase